MKIKQKIVKIKMIVRNQNNILNLEIDSFKDLENNLKKMEINLIYLLIL